MELSQQSRQRTPPQGNWPRECLESVEKCPVCGECTRSLLYAGLTDRVFFCAPGAWTLFRCPGCGSAYLDPRPTPESIGLAYSNYFTHHDPATTNPVPHTRLGRLRRAIRNGYLNARYGYNYSHASALGAWIMPLLTALKFKGDQWVRGLHLSKQGARLLDVGCGNGAFLAEMRSAGWVVQGLEQDPEAVARVQEAGLPVRQGVLVEGIFPENHFDAITLSNVIEHMHDPITVLRVCYRILRPGGVLWIDTPNLVSQGHRLFGKHWVHLDPPRHLVMFTADSLKGAVEGIGFAVVPDATAAARGIEWVFQASLAISQGSDPIHDSPPLSASQKWEALLAGLRGWWHSELREELVLLAKKP